MTQIRRTLLKALDTLGVNLDDASIQIGIKDDELPAFKKAVTALRNLKQGVRFKAIHAETGLIRQKVSYLVKRLMVTGLDGKPLGLRALTKGAQKDRVYPEDVVSKGRPAPGAVKTLFKLHPDICRSISDLALHGRHPKFKEPLDRRLVTDDLVHLLLLDLCEAKGIKAPQYPFCGTLQGKKSLSNWVKKARAAQAQEEHRARLEASLESELRYRIRRAYARVEADAHSIAVKWILRVPSLRSEGYIDIVVDRIWLIALIECSSSAVLGRSFAFGSNYSGSDFMRAVNQALVPWKRLAGYGDLYKPLDGMPCGEPDLQWRAWDVLAVDSAMAHTCGIALTTLARAVNCVLEVGPVGQPDERGHIEGLFSSLNEVIKHLVGFKEKPHERGDGDGDGRLIIDFDLLIAALDLIIARFNGSIAPGTSMTRLEALKYAVNREAAIGRKVPLAIRSLCERYDTFDTARIGKNKRGHAVVRWQSATYEGLGLASAPDLIGQDVLVAADSQDPRLINAWLQRDGTDLRELRIEPRYRATAASLTTRQHIKRSMHANSFLRNAMNLPLAFRQLHEARGRKRNADNQELARLLIEQVFSRAPSAPVQAPAQAIPPPPGPAALIAPAPAPNAPPGVSPTPAPVIPFPTSPAPVKQLSEVEKAIRAITSI